VILNPGRSLDEQTLVAYCRKLLPGFKVQKAIGFTEALPKNGDR